MDDVVARAGADGVVAVAAEQEVAAVAADDPVVAAIAPDRVATGHAGLQPVVARRAAQHHGVAQEVVVTDEADGAVVHDIDQRLAGHGVVRPGGRVVGIDGAGLDRVLRRLEGVATQVVGAGVAHDHRGKRVVLDLRAPVRALDARQVVEPVAVLQAFELGLEDEVEGRTQQAAKQGLLLGQPANPQVHVVQAGDGAGAPGGVLGQRIQGVVGIHALTVHEVESVLAESRVTDGGVRDEVQRRRALVHQRGGVLDAGVGAVGGHEVDQRARVLEELAEVVPAVVGLEAGVVGLAEQLVAQQVQRGHTGVAAARDVQGRQVQRQAQQVVAQRAGDKLVDLVADLVDRAEHDLAGGILAGGGKGERVEEGVDQADRIEHGMAGGIEHRGAVGADLVTVDVLVQHGVAEAIDGMRKLGRDRRIQRNVDIAEQVDGGRNLAREFIKHQVLVLRFGTELGHLEQPLAVPLVVLDAIGQVGAR